MMPFFSGEYSNRGCVYLGGHSLLERDRRNRLGKTPSGRKELRDEETAKRKRIKEAAARRLENYAQRCLENFAARKIQKQFRVYKVVTEEHHKQWQKFVEAIYVNGFMNTFGPDSLGQFLDLFNERYIDPILVLMDICQWLLKLVDNVDEESGKLKLTQDFVVDNYSSNEALGNYRVKKLAYACVRALYFDGKQHLSNPREVDGSVILLKVLKLLTDFKLPWSCMIIEYLSQNKGFSLLREFILTGKNRSEDWIYGKKGSALEHFLTTVFYHIDQKQCICSDIDLRRIFSSQILTIPNLWNIFPNFKKVFARQGMISCLSSFIPENMSDKFPTYAHLLASPSRNIYPSAQSDVLIDPAVVPTFPMEEYPFPTRFGSKENSVMFVADMSDAKSKEEALRRILDQQNCYYLESELFLSTTHKLFIEFSNVEGPYDMEVVAVNEVCGAFYNKVKAPPEKFTKMLMSNPAYESELLPFLWDFMKRHHKIKQFPSLSDGDNGWLLHLAVFCPVYNHMLKKVDNEEFYKQEKPLSMDDIKSLVILLKQALLKLLWVNHTSSANSVRSIPVKITIRKPSIEAIQQRVIIVVSELLSQLQDRNNRKQFTSPSDFEVHGVNDDFISQAVIENTRANEILKKAPFLIPLTSRVEIFKSQVAAARTSNENQFIIRRDHILDDGYNQITQLSEDDLRGKIRVTYVNDHGIQEAGIDAGGLFKDFMENITRASFDVQCGLFKETEDHQLYPNPRSGNNNETLFFHGTLLGKNYKDDLSELELYFTFTNINEYGEKTEEELLPGGMHLRVTNENVHDYIYHVRHRLNLRMHEQYFHFLSGFQILIQKRWTDMFNENELQLLISGSPGSLDVDNLRQHTIYKGNYHSEHPVIKTFWEVLEGFSMENKEKFLKFVTAYTRGPPLGFAYLDPLFCIQRADGDAPGRLPTAATCFNKLKLPPYESKDQLKSKLLYAIEADPGFYLS